MAKKKQELTVEEKLAAALVREDEWPYEVPGNWVWVRLGSVAACSKEKYNDFDSADEKRYIGLEHIQKDDGIIGHGSSSEVKSQKNVFEVGDVLYGKLRPYLNKHDIATFEGICSTDILVLKAKKICLNKLINYYLDTDYFICNAIANSKGINLPRVSETIVLDTIFPLPPLAEQQRLVDRIESLFDQLDQAKALIQEALDSFETRKAAILHQAFTGALTKKWREEHGVGMESWEEISLKSLCSKITDGEHFRPPVVDKGIPFLSAKDVRNNGVSFQNVLYVANETANKALKRCNPEKGDILIVSRGATVGRMCIVDNDETFCLLGSVILLKVDKMNSHLLNYFLKAPSSNEKLIKVSGASAQQAIYLRDIKEILIPVPSKAEQQEIVRILDDLFEKEQAAKDLCDQIDQIDTIKKTILGQAFRGQLRTNVVGEESAVELLKELLIVV